MPNFAFLYQQARFSGYSVEGGGGEREALAEQPGGMGTEQAALTDGSTCQRKSRALLKSSAKASQVHRQQIWAPGIKRILLAELPGKATALPGALSL